MDWRLEAGTMASGPQVEQRILDYTDTVYAVALKFTHNKAEAFDLASDTMEEALRAFDAGKLQTGTRIKPWLLATLRNTFLDDSSSTQRRTRLDRRPGTISLS